MSAWLRRIPRNPRAIQRLRLRGLRTNRQVSPPFYSPVAAPLRSSRQIPIRKRRQAPATKRFSFCPQGNPPFVKTKATLGCRTSIVNSRSHCACTLLILPAFCSLICLLFPFSSLACYLRLRRGNFHVCKQSDSRRPPRPRSRNALHRRWPGRRQFLRRHG